VPGDDGSAPATPAFEFDAEWDAGDMGCGDLVLELRMRMKSMPSRQIFRLHATNPGAKEDIPSWCRLTGNALLEAAPPIYLIRKK
jgi:tRNA 2-thiouridine synthesizing protein A